MSEFANEIYKIGTSLEKDRPEIDFDAPATAAIDWLRVGDVIRGERPVTDYESIDIRVDSPKATTFHWYRCGGPNLVSRPLCDLIKPHTAWFEFLPARLNGEEYFFIMPTEKLRRHPGGLDCLDRDRSEVRYAADDPKEVSYIYKYAFRPRIVPNSCVFCIPEAWGSIFATESIKQSVEEAGLKGVRFDLLYSFT